MLTMQSLQARCRRYSTGSNIAAAVKEMEASTAALECLTDSDILVRKARCWVLCVVGRQFGSVSLVQPPPSPSPSLSTQLLPQVQLQCSRTSLLICVSHIMWNLLVVVPTYFILSSSLLISPHSTLLHAQFTSHLFQSFVIVLYIL